MRDLYREVTDRIVAELKTGAAPWVKPWRATPGQNSPYNVVSRRGYSGINVVLLWVAAEKNGWSQPAYLTFKQAKGLGGTVRGGEHGIQIIFIKRLLVKDRDADPEDDPRQISMMREYTVFNVAQCDGLPEQVTSPVTRAPLNNDERDPLVDEFLADTGADIREGGEAYYVPSKDFIMMPKFADFKNADSYYNTLLHELGHWTGHKSRLDRAEGMKSRFKDAAYAAEELVAELNAAFLAAEFSINGELRSAGYIEHWIKLLTEDPKAIFTAASKAQRATEYLRELVLANTITNKAAA